MSRSRTPPATLVGRAFVTLLLVLILAGLSRVPLGSDVTDEAALRFSWRLRGEEAATCRLPTEEELADLPVHMRNPEACVGVLPPFELRVDLDDVTWVSRQVLPSGARGDRPLFVYEELRVPPGQHRLSVRFGAQGDGSQATRSLSLDTTVVLEVGRVLLVSRTIDGDLEVRSPIR
jgi:hypothetical protein